MAVMLRSADSLCCTLVSQGASILASVEHGVELKNRSWFKRIAIGSACGLVAVSLTTAKPAHAVTFLASVAGTLPSSASISSPVEVIVEGVPDLSGAAVNGTTTDPILATQQLTSGASFSIAIPDSATAESITSPTEGTINTHTVVVSAQGTTDTYATVPASTVRPGIATLGTLPAYDPTMVDSYAAAQGISVGSVVSAPNVIVPPACKWTTTVRTNDEATRIGEMHVIGGTGVKVTAVYSYEDNADSTFTVGTSSNGEDWSESGTIEVTNGGSTTDTVSYPSNYIKYIDAHFDYVKQQANSASPLSCGHEWRAMAANWDGDIIPGSNQPAGNPYGGCRNDPNGYAELTGSNTSQPNTWGHFSSTGVSYDTVASAFGFTFGGHTGFETTNGFEYSNPKGGATVYLCSTTSPVDNWHVIYNTQ